MITRFGRRLFVGPRLKIGWGRRHASQLKAEIALYLSNDPWALLKYLDRNTGEHGLLFVGSDPIPDQMSLIFGDAVHNFRSSLDILANDLVAFSGVKPEKVQFPFAKSRDRFNRELKSNMRGAAPEILSLIAKFEPFTGGNALLRAVHDLDITDKHIDLIQAAAGAASPPLPMRIPHGNEAGELARTADFGALPAVEVDVSRYHIASDPNIMILGKVVDSTVDMTIAESLPLGGIPAVIALNDMGDLVDQVREALESLCLGSDGA